MSKLLGRFLLSCLFAFSTTAYANPPDAFERITPEQAGYSSQRLAELRTFLQQSGSDSLLLSAGAKVKCRSPESTA